MMLILNNFQLLKIKNYLINFNSNFHLILKEFQHNFIKQFLWNKFKNFCFHTNKIQKIVSLKKVNPLQIIILELKSFFYQVSKIL